MSVKEDLRRWKSRIEVSGRLMQPMLDDLDTYLRYYRSDQWHDTSIAGRYGDQVVDNIIFPNIRAMIPRVCFRNPKLFVKPMKKPSQGAGGEYNDTVGQAMCMELLLNYYFRHLDVKREARKCLYNAYLGHLAIMEIGYTLETEKIKEKGEKGELIEVDELIKKDSVFVKQRSVKDLRRDPEAEDHLLHDDRWIAMRWCKSLEDIKENNMYENTRGLTTNYRVKTDITSGSAHTATDVEKEMEDGDIWGRVEGWTIWDKKLRRRMDVVEQHNKFLSNAPFPKWMDNIEGFPVEILYINENPGEPFPLSDISIYKKAQDEINMMGSMQISHIRRLSQRRYVANANIDEEELYKITNGGDGAVALVDGNPNDKIVSLKDSGISQDIYAVLKAKKQEASEMAGVTAMERSQTTKFETAEEPRVMMQNSDTLRGDQRGLFENFIVRVARKMGAVLQATIQNETIPLDDKQFDGVKKFIMNENPAVRPTQRNIVSKLDKIVGEKGTILNPWLNLSSDDVKGDFEFEIEANSTAPLNNEERRRDAMTLAKALADNPWIRQKEGTIALLEAFDRKDIDILMKKDEEFQQEQQQQQQQQMQMASMEPQADMQKKQMDIQKAVMTTKMKTESDQIIESMRQSGEGERTLGKVAGDLVKEGMKEKKEKPKGGKE